MNCSLATALKINSTSFESLVCVNYCQDCIQEHNEPVEKDKKRHHCWAAVGHNFKSEIYFYEVVGQQVYINQILDTIVKPWIQAHQDFVLEEDADLGHRPRRSNIVERAK